MGHALSPCASLEVVLERCNGFFCGFGDLLCHGPRGDPTECVPPPQFHERLRLAFATHSSSCLI